MNAIINFWFIQKFYIEGYTVYIRPIISIAIIIIMIIIIIKRKLYSTYKTQKKQSVINNDIYNHYFYVDVNDILQT